MLWFGLIRSGLEHRAASESQLPATAEDTLLMELKLDTNSVASQNCLSFLIFLSTLVHVPVCSLSASTLICLSPVCASSLFFSLLSNSAFQLQSSPSFSVFDLCNNFHLVLLPLLERLFLLHGSNFLCVRFSPFH